nr:hypothetical protein [Shewanella glacialipiscicola]
MYSLRLVLTLLILSGISVSVAVSSWLSTRDSKHQIEELFDAQMLQTAKMLELFYHTDLGVPVRNQTKLQILHVPDSQISTFAEKADALKLAYEHKLAFQIWGRRVKHWFYPIILVLNRLRILYRVIIRLCLKASFGMYLVSSR